MQTWKAIAEGIVASRSFIEFMTKGNAMYELPSHIRSVKDIDGTTVLDLKKNLILSLNGTGAFIWEHLRQGSSFTDMVDALATEANAERSKVEMDTRVFIEDLVRKGLLCEGLNKG
jgi:hypothetical protein